jgi:hypothetical protein
MPSHGKPDADKPARLPGKLLTCERCGQQPESIAVHMSKRQQQVT